MVLLLLLFLSLISSLLFVKHRCRWFTGWRRLSQPCHSSSCKVLKFYQKTSTLPSSAFLPSVNGRKASKNWAFVYSSLQLLICWFNLLIHKFICLVICPYIHPSILLFIHNSSFHSLFIHSFICSFSHSYICLFIPSFIGCWRSTNRQTQWDIQKVIFNNKLGNS